MEKTPDINRQLNELTRIAKGFDQEALNDGEAGLLKSRVEACVKSIEKALPELPLLSDRDVKQLKSKFQKVEEEFQKVFTPQNEKEFEALKKAHHSFDSLKGALSPEDSLRSIWGLFPADKDLEEVVTTTMTESQKLENFLKSHRFQKIGHYLQKNLDDIFDRLEDNPYGGKSLYIRRSDSGLARSIQVFLPAEKTSKDEMIFVIQMKQHGKRRKRDMIQEWFPVKFTGADPDRLQVVGKGSYKVAKHSLTFPSEALGKNGVVNPRQIIFTTTLTPKTQSKEFLDQHLLISELAPDVSDIEEKARLLMEFGRESVEKDVEYHIMFQGPGILPIIGSSQYEGSYPLRDPTLFEWWTAGTEVLKLAITKFSVVTLRCDGDLAFDPDQIFEWDEKQSMARDIVSGIQTIHDKGYQHGDIKPENILFKRVKGKMRAYLVDFGFSREWNKEEKLGTPSFMPVGETGLPEANHHYDSYATGLSLLGLLTHRQIISPSEAAIRDYEGYQRQVKSFSQDLELLNTEAERRALPVEDLKAELKKKKEMWKDVDFLCDRNHLEALFFDDDLAKENPLAYAFVKVLYLHHIPEENLWKDEMLTRLFGEGEKPKEGDDLTIPILNQLLTQIAKIKKEENVQLDVLIRSV